MTRRRRRAVYAALLLALGAFLSAWLLDPASPDVYAGVPRPQHWAARLFVHTLQNPGFAVGYSEWHRQPVWVAYRARRPPQGAASPRPDSFWVDARTLARVGADDYRDPDYQRGHLAPNYLISRLYGPLAQHATFLMSNIAPQTPRLNQLLWQRLEEAEADIVAPADRDLWVVTGPVFDRNHPKLESGVAVPGAFYRIWLDADAPRALAFVVPQQVCGDERLGQFVVSVDAVEAQTGLEFFRELDDGVEARLESAAADGKDWQLGRFDRAAARYAKKFKGGRCVSAWNR